MSLRSNGKYIGKMNHQTFLLSFYFTFIIPLFCIDAKCKPPTTAPIVTTRYGKVAGSVMKFKQNDDYVYLYQGIRYANVKRFEKPVRTKRWRGVFNGTKHPSCPQYYGRTDDYDEDCLYLSIWTPSTRLPIHSVMVWLHGGSFRIGSGRFDSSRLSLNGNSVIVNINYRLGPFGFICLGDVERNLGLYDQLFALKWVRENIAAFGGSPYHVTVFGISSGAYSIGAMMVSPLARGLFRNAIIQSDLPLLTINSQEKQEQISRGWAKKLNCTVEIGKEKETIECLRKKDKKDLQWTMPINFERFQLVYGDKFIPEKPIRSILNGNFNHVNILYGVVNTEGTEYYEIPRPLTVETVRQKIHEYAENHTNIVQYYMSKLANTTEGPDPDMLKLILVEAIGDKKVVCPLILLIQEIAKHSPFYKSFYSYRLMDNPAMRFTWENVPHTTDLLYLEPMEDEPGLNETYHAQLSHDMIMSWTNFAKTGHPIRMGSTNWYLALNKYYNHHTKFMYLNATNYHMVKHEYVYLCEKLWKPIVYDKYLET
ncbi:hypothetical protein BLOT_008801 [Blomia tropicalis]|nr:hypothetical protein BLOT_008801 [Blomia tropicalis]